MGGAGYGGMYAYPCLVPGIPNGVPIAKRERILERDIGLDGAWYCGVSGQQPIWTGPNFRSWERTTLGICSHLLLSLNYGSQDHNSPGLVEDTKTES